MRDHLSHEWSTTARLQVAYNNKWTHTTLDFHSGWWLMIDDDDVWWLFDEDADPNAPHVPTTTNSERESNI